MRIGIIMSLLISFLWVSCNSKQKNTGQSQQVPTDTTDRVTANDIKDHKVIDTLQNEVKFNLVLCKNDDYTLQVDRLTNNDIRYMSWNQPKSRNAAPDLILTNGDVERQGTGGGYHYSFTNGDVTYIVENNLMGETVEAMGIFLKVMQNDNELLYTRMEDLNE